jgi:hypothetical protein
MNIITRLFKDKLKINWIKREIRLRFGRHSTVRVAIDGEIFCVHDVSLTGLGLYCDSRESKQFRVGEEIQVSIRFRDKILDLSSRVMHLSGKVMGLSITSSVEVYQIYINQHLEDLEKN